MAVVAVNYGDARHPGWYHNLKANPAASVTIDGDTWDTTARHAHPETAADTEPVGTAA